MCGVIIFGPLQGEWCNGPAPAKEAKRFLEEMLALVFCLCYSKSAVRRHFAFLSIQFSGVSPGFPYKKNYFAGQAGSVMLIGLRTIKFRLTFDGKYTII